MKNSELNSLDTKDYLKFIIPSLLGVLLFMTPVKHGDNVTIAIAIAAAYVQESFKTYLPSLIVALLSITGILTLAKLTFKPKIIEENSFLNKLLDVSVFWSLVRIFGMILGLMVYFELGASWIYGQSTGGLLLYDLMPVLVSVFLFAGFFLSLLLDFGLLEYVGTLLSKFMRPIFTLPGRASIDCITSWLGDGTLGVMLTNRQYEDGFYNLREAAVIATNFSAVSISFSLIIISQLGLDHMFVPYYLTVLLAGLVAAIIVPRIPPLSRKANSYYGGECMDRSEELPEGFTKRQWALRLAGLKARDSFKPGDFIKTGFFNVLDMWLGVLPAVMAFGGLAVILAEKTPIFQWLGLPFIPLLKLLRIPYAKEASQTIIIGFADMFLPAVLGANIPSPLTRFVIAGVSVTQLIYISEVGAVILGSRIPISLKELFIIFLERTLVTLPIVALIGHILF